MRLYTTALFCALGTSLLSAHVEKDTTDIIDLKDVVITSRRSAHLSQIAKVDLQVNPVKSSQEILRTVPGLFIAQHAGGGKAEQMFLRGFDLDHGTDINLSVDGMPVTWSATHMVKATPTFISFNRK